MAINNEPTRNSKPNPIMNGVSVRLVVLIAMFFCVLWLMFEARKPENWDWMGFGRDAQKSNNETSNQDVEPSKDDRSAQPKVIENEDDSIKGGADHGLPKRPDLHSDSTDNSRDTGFDLKLQESSKQREPQTRFEIQLANLSLNVDAVESDFWRQSFYRFSLLEQKQFFFLLRYAQGFTTADNDQIEIYKKLVDRLDSWRTDYQSKILEHVGSLTNDRLEERKSWNEVLFQIQNRWGTLIKPALLKRMEGDSPSQTDIEQLESAKSHLQRFSNNLVRDQTPISRARESVAWMIAWDRIVNDARSSSTGGGPDATTQSSTPVTQVQLSSQPQSYRGDNVRIKGRVRAAEKQEFENHPLGIKHFYILWIRSYESPTIPICVYCLNLPKGFPEVAHVRKDYDESFDATGVFYKIRSYSTQGGWEYCPTVLTEDFVWHANSSVINKPAALPSWPVLIFLLLAMAWVAFFIARVAYRSVWVSRRSNAKNESKVIDEVRKLADNPLVETVDQRLARLADQHRGQTE